MGILLESKPLILDLLKDLTCEVSLLKCAGILPHLAVVQVGQHPPSSTYINRKRTVAANIGIGFSLHRLDDDSIEDEVIEVIHTLNHDPKVHGIIVQLPLPASLNSDAVIREISPHKDVDGLTPYSLGRLTAGDTSGFIPCTPNGCLHLIRSVCPDLAGMNAVIIGRSALVGRPMAALLTGCDATVTLAHSKTRDLAQVAKRADILVAAAGQPGLVTADFVREGAVVIDVGITRSGNAILGDVDALSVLPVAAYLTPVPGGVGPMTVTQLMLNTLKAASARADS